MAFVDIQFVCQHIEGLYIQPVGTTLVLVGTDLRARLWVLNIMPGSIN